MKKLFVFLGVALVAAGSALRAQEADSTVPMQKSSWGDAKTTEAVNYIPEVSLDMRGGFNYGNIDGSGQFYGDGLYLDINGNISPHFSYSFNHRIASTYYGEATGFDATNWLTLTYEVGDFAFTAGKDALLMGSFEYDAYDLDSYYDMNSAFYNSFDCWQWGVSAAWYPAETQEFIIQFASSPFSYGEPDLFSYAAAWRSYWDWYESYWTVNLWQYDSGSYIKAVNLGNRFSFGGFIVDLDLMGRFGDLEEAAGYTGTIAPSYEFGDWGRIFTKAGMDMFAGEKNFFFGGGFEYFPLKDNRNIRLHAAYTHNDFMYGNTFDIGLTWKMNLTKGIRSLFGISED